MRELRPGGHIHTVSADLHSTDHLDGTKGDPTDKTAERWQMIYMFI